MVSVSPRHATPRRYAATLGAVVFSVVLLRTLVALLRTVAPFLVLTRVNDMTEVRGTARRVLAATRGTHVV